MRTLLGLLFGIAGFTFGAYIGLVEFIWFNSIELITSLINETWTVTSIVVRGLIVASGFPITIGICYGSIKLGLILAGKNHKQFTL